MGTTQGASSGGGRQALLFLVIGIIFSVISITLFIGALSANLLMISVAIAVVSFLMALFNVVRGTRTTSSIKDETSLSTSVDTPLANTLETLSDIQSEYSQLKYSATTIATESVAEVKTTEAVVSQAVATQEAQVESALVAEVQSKEAEVSQAVATQETRVESATVAEVQTNVDHLAQSASVATEQVVASVAEVQNIETTITQTATIEEHQNEEDESSSTEGSITAYCVKCKTKRVIQNAHSVTMKNGRPALQGTCPVCGTGLYRMMKA